MSVAPQAVARTHLEVADLRDWIQATRAGLVQARHDNMSFGFEARLGGGSTMLDLLERWLENRAGGRPMSAKASVTRHSAATIRAPWKAKLTDAGRRWHVTNNQDQVVVSIAARPGYSLAEARQARTARVIAAAPRMLELLTRLVEQGYDQETIGAEAYDLVRAIDGEARS